MGYGAISGLRLCFIGRAIFLRKVCGVATPLKKIVKDKDFRDKIVDGFLTGITFGLYKP